MSVLENRLASQLLATAAASFHVYGCDDCVVFADWPAEDVAALLAGYRSVTGDVSETPTPAAWMTYLAGRLKSEASQ